MTITSLEQRMAHTYMDMFPKFIPDKSAKIDIAEQEEFYSLIKNLYQLAFNAPLLFVSSLHEDDAYPNRFKKSYGKPELINNMRKFTKAIDSLLQSMYLVGQDSNVKISKKQQEILSKLDINNTTASDCKLSLTYANILWSKETPKGGFEYKIRHTGISAQYDFYTQDPACFGLCIPNGLKTYLDVFDTMSAKNKNFVVNRTKKCDGCRYCVQTDKTGTRPLAFVQVNYEQKNITYAHTSPDIVIPGRVSTMNLWIS